MMKLRLWGVRGSIPTPSPETVLYGGNTTCLEIRVGEAERLVIVDAGSGIRPLGGHIMGKDFPKGPLKLDLFFSHTHWDHILGFPFFIPIYVPSTELKIYGPVSFEEETMRAVISDLLQYRYFPVNLDELKAAIRYQDLREGKFDLGDNLTVTTKFLNHPLTCLGYRFEYRGASLVTLFDHEPFRNVFPTDPDHPDYEPILAREGEKAAQDQNNKILEFMRGADIVIHDAQYTQKEYLKGKIGWGHSSYEWAINQAHRAGVKRLVLVHHDPDRKDRELEDLERSYARSIMGKSSMELIFGREGMVFELKGR